MTTSPVVGEDVTAASQPTPNPRYPTQRRIETQVVPGAVVLLSVVAGWLNRWTADDALITLRVAKQILAGHGPVYNTGERVEASTSVIWPWILACLAWTRIDLAWLAVDLGLLLSASSIWIGYRACLRLHETSDPSLRFAPLGVLVVLALPAFWQYFTSGLETGLTFFWLAASWAFLIAYSRDGHRARSRALFVGLGSLVRPELALVSLVFGLALLFIRKRSWRERMLMAFLLAVPTLAYELFRVAYFGVLVPTPAIAKEAGLSNWRQGGWYAFDLIFVYQLWLPLVALWLLAVTWARRAARVERFLIITPVSAGLLTATYITKAGGDFMHARLLLPSLFVLLLPFFCMPLRRDRSRLAVLAVATWAVMCAAALRLPYYDSKYLVIDERAEWVALTGSQHPITTAEHERSVEKLAVTAEQAQKLRERVLVFENREADTERPTIVPLHTGSGDHLVVAGHILGATGFVAPLNVTVRDVRGLADPLAARIEIPKQRGRPGHEKWLPDSWLLARDADLSRLTSSTQDADVHAAGHALSCGALRELIESYSAPLTWDRAWQNITGAWARTELRIPANPIRAEADLC